MGAGKALKGAVGAESKGSEASFPHASVALQALERAEILHSVEGQHFVRANIDVLHLESFFGADFAVRVSVAQSQEVA